MARRSYQSRGSRTMKHSELQGMPVKELIELRSEVDDLIREKRVSERQELRHKIEAMAREAGLSVSDILGGRGRRGGGARKGSKIAPKYRNPKNPSETWTGRGRRPRWMVAAGGDPSRFLIQ
jgi:DNA-binding protein H-NS